MKKLLSIILVILMIATGVPMTFAADSGEPLIIDVTDLLTIEIGEGYQYYDADGYILTGTNVNADISVKEDSNLTFENLTVRSFVTKDDPEASVINIELVGTNEITELLSILDEDIIIDGENTAVLNVMGISEYSNDGSVTINGGVINAYNDAVAINQEIFLNGGVLNIVNTSAGYYAIDEKITMKKGALLTVSAEGQILSPWIGFDGYSADIVIADGAEETDYLFVRYDKTSEFTPVPDIRAALEGRKYAEIKIDTHEHTLNKVGRCNCGYECPHENVTTDGCPDCGAKENLTTITMTDIYDSGWDDNAIVIEQLVDGERKEISNVTKYDGNVETYTTFLDSDGVYFFKWKEGYFAEECRFTVTINGVIVYELADGSAPADGQVFYVFCEHIVKNSNCAKCGGECGVDFEHIIEDFVCTECGKYMYQIIHQPTSDELYVGLNNDSGASYQWYLVSYGTKENPDEIVYTAVDGETSAKLVNSVIGNEYVCKVFFSDGTTETSDIVMVEPPHFCDFTGEWKTDSEKHWKECECGEIGEEAEHSYTDSEWEYDADSHWKECECGCSSPDENHQYADGICSVCDFVCAHDDIQDGVCQICAYVCTHEETFAHVSLRPVKNEDDTWNKGTAEKTCSLCNKVISTIEVERDHEGYELFDETAGNLALLLSRDDIVKNKKDEMLDSLADIRNTAYLKVYTEVEKDFLASLIKDIEEKITAIEEGLADKTLKKADLSDLKALIDEAYNAVGGDFSNILHPMVEDYRYAVYFYEEKSVNLNYSQYIYELDFSALRLGIRLNNIIVGVDDGSALKPDYTEIDKAIAEVEKRIEDESLTDRIKESFWFIKSALEFKRDMENTSAADVSALAKELEDYERMLDAGIADGSALKADYTEIDEAITEAEDKYADENLTDEAKAGLDEIKAQLEKMKADENTSVADVSKLAKELEAYETELDAGIADGSAVEVNGLEEIVEINDALNNDLAEKYGEEALAEIVEKIGEKLDKEIEAVYEKAEALIGSVAENADALAEIEAEMAEIFAKVENCLNGTHNGLDYAVTEKAKCGKNAIESATCILCDEVLTREVENSALKHSFTKYETVEEAKCGVAGKAVAYCDNACGETNDKAIDALTHIDADGDYICDNGCGHEFEKPAEPDTPDEPTDETCDHICHKTGILGFFWKIAKFFSKLFKTNPVCECGVAHY